MLTSDCGVILRVKLFVDPAKICVPTRYNTTGWKFISCLRIQLMHTSFGINVLFASSNLSPTSVSLCLSPTSLLLFLSACVCVCVLLQFMHLNNLTLICRAHQLVQEGIKFMFDSKLVTVWSAPNYCYRCGNIASILDFTTARKYEPKLFSAVPDSARTVPPRMATPYFM